jgi:23S rRNA G2069 N7-methylase RlmK/C1962 C5-methylase RlmI
VDESSKAIALAVTNRGLNSIPESSCEFVTGEVGKFMAAALEQGQQYDLIILDPPKLAPSKKVLAQALRKYRKYARFVLLAHVQTGQLCSKIIPFGLNCLLFYKREGGGSGLERE